MTNEHGHILVVDDDSVNRLRLSRFLQQQGHATLTAKNGQQAIEVVSEQPLDLMLLDIIMPEMDGYQVLEHMKQYGMLRNLPVIMISALDDMEGAIKCIEIGAKDYLPKPCNQVLLRAKIDAYLEKKRLRAQEREYVKNVDILTRAAAAIESELSVPENLKDVALRQDELGRLARVFTNMIREMQAREEQLKKAHAEMQTLNQAKSKMIDHLSHELKTPLAIISTSIKLLHKPALHQNEERFQSILTRIEHHLQRLFELEEESRDIVEGNNFHERLVLEDLIRQCQDLFSVLVEEHNLPETYLNILRQRIIELYPPHDYTKTDIALHLWIPNILETINAVSSHRDIHVELELEPCPALRIPESILHKVFRGLVRNAIENTPDGGTVQIRLYQQNTSLFLAVKDFGVGMDEQFQQQLFHGFIHRGDTNDYSSGNPYDFGAGGQGLDLLRTKLYSERLGFYIRVESRRCPCIQPENPCPGRTKSGRCCSNETDCQKLGGSTFVLEFPLSMLVTASHDSMMKE